MWISPGSPGWPRLLGCVDQDSLRLLQDLSASAFQVLELKVCATLPGQALILLLLRDTGWVLQFYLLLWLCCKIFMCSICVMI